MRGWGLSSEGGGKGRGFALFSLAWGSNWCKETYFFSVMLLVLCFLEVLSLLEVLDFGKQDLPK